MVSKYTILTEKRLKDIEEIVASSGRIVTAYDVYKTLGKTYSKFAINKRLYELKKKGWLVSLKRGLYFITDITSRGFAGISPFIIANAFNKNSYISLESAFNFYNLFEQMLKTINSVTIDKSKSYIFQNNTYRFLKIKKNLYFGFKDEVLEGYYFKIAELEKAALDYLYFRNDVYSMDLILEILQKAKDKLDLGKLFGYAKKFPQTTKRKIGFILDLLDVDTRELLGLVGKKGYSKLTSSSNRFNAKWRIYYEDRFVKQTKT